MMPEQQGNSPKPQAFSSRSELVKRIDVARFMRISLEEVTRMIDQDDLPHVRVPGPQRVGYRIFLPDLHAWLCLCSQFSPRLANYSEFLRAFWAAQERRPPLGRG
jgi:hypothetical protein